MTQMKNVMLSEAREKRALGCTQLTNFAGRLDFEVPQWSDFPDELRGPPHADTRRSTAPPLAIAERSRRMSRSALRAGSTGKMRRHYRSFRNRDGNRGPHVKGCFRRWLMSFKE